MKKVIKVLIGILGMVKLLEIVNDLFLNKIEDEVIKIASIEENDVEKNDK